MLCPLKGKKAWWDISSSDSCKLNQIKGSIGFTLSYLSDFSIGFTQTQSSSAKLLKPDLFYKTKQALYIPTNDASVPSHKSTVLLTSSPCWTLWSLLQYRQSGQALFKPTQIHIKFCWRSWSLQQILEKCEQNGGEYFHLMKQSLVWELDKDNAQCL